MDEIKNMKRLNIEIPPELHKEIKSRALWRNVTLQHYVLEAILEKMEREDHYQ